MIARLSVTFLLVAVPAAGQSRIYTNADLGKIERTRTVTDAELASLRSRQFVYVPPRAAGPEAIVLNGSTAEGPFGPFVMPPREPLDPFYYNGPQWVGGWGHYGSGRVNVSVPNLTFPSPIGVPAFARGPVVPEFARGPVVPEFARGPIPTAIAPSLGAPTASGHRGHRR